jgi:hypothetical protein
VSRALANRGEPTKTIGDARAGGETKLTIHFLGCYHEAVKTSVALERHDLR